MRGSPGTAAGVHQVGRRTCGGREGRVVVGVFPGVWPGVGAGKGTTCWGWEPPEPPPGDSVHCTHASLWKLHKVFTQHEPLQYDKKILPGTWNFKIPLWLCQNERWCKKPSPSESLLHTTGLTIYTRLAGIALAKRAEVLTKRS